MWDFIFQDITYYQCIEVCGQQDLIIAAMKHLTSSDIGNMFNFSLLLHNCHPVSDKRKEFQNKLKNPLPNLS